MYVHFTICKIANGKLMYHMELNQCSVITYSGGIGVGSGGKCQEGGNIVILNG